MNLREACEKSQSVEFISDGEYIGSYSSSYLREELRDLDRLREFKALIEAAPHYVAGVHVGQYRLVGMANSQVWIGHASGEGMACDAAILEAALAAFWAEHF